tara:strand:- start:15339 stop:17315 length:1977 start_codon:yes stop_codon:yes gene_type:complete
VELNSLIGFIAFSFIVLFLIDKFYFSKKWNSRFLFGVLIQLLIIGLAVLYSIQNQKINKQPYISQDDELIWLAKVVDVQEKARTKQTLLIELSHVYNDSTWKELKSEVIIYFSDSSKISVGDVIAGSSYFKEFSEPLNPAQFNFKQYNFNKYRYYFAFEDRVTILDHKQSVNSLAAASRVKLEEGFVQMGIQNDELAVLKALTLGDKSEINPDLRSKFAEAGAMHILAVSGLHVGIIFLILSQILNFLGNRNFQRWLKALLLLIGIWAFALLTGFSPSVQRASWMFSFIILATALKRDTNVINSLAASALLLLLIDPNVLFEVGFQLSYSAVLGIVLIYPKLFPLFKTENKWINKVIGLFVVSFAAQLATMPLSIYYFHQFPNWFLITNLFAIPLAFVIVSGGFILSIVWLLIGNDFYLGTILNKTLQFLNYLVDLSALLPYSAITGIWFQPISILLFYVSAVFFIIFLYFNRKGALLVCLSLIFVVFTFELTLDYKQLHKKKIVFYALKADVISVVNGIEAAVFINDSLLDYYDQLTVEQHLQSVGITKISWIFNDLDSINHRLFNYRRISDFKELRAFNHRINFIENINGLIDLNANTVFLQKDIPINELLIDKIPPNIKLVFSSKIPTWSKKHLEFSDEFPVQFLSSDGYFELSF